MPASAPTLLGPIKVFIRLMYYSSRKLDVAVVQARRQTAQQRWSIIRLVKNSDTEAEQIARKEKLQVKGMLGLVGNGIVL